MIPEEDFRLFVVGGRHPDGMFARQPFAQVGAGVYDLRWGPFFVRRLTAPDLPLEPQNIPVHLFSAIPEVLEYARRNVRLRTTGMSLLLLRLFGRYRVEGLDVPITMEEFIRESRQLAIAEATPEERLAGLAPEQRLAGLAPEQLAEALRRNGVQLTPEQIAALSQIGCQASPPTSPPAAP